MSETRPITDYDFEIDNNTIQMDNIKLLHGDCLHELKELEDNSIDSIVTDPPYGLSAAKNSGKSSKGGFMNKHWDYDVPDTEIWKECLRVLKPGGHLLSFAGTRTYHRMAVRIEDAGFEIRDMISWIYGSGFPKSHNIGKAIDKLQGNEREVVGVYQQPDGTPRNIENHSLNDTVRLADHKYGYKSSGYIEQTKGNSEWEGWGTALKPAHEPIVMARKPLSENTVVDNVLKYGTGGINIDDSRIALNGDYKSKPNGRPSLTGLSDNYDSSKANQADTIGRFPANIIFDEEAGKVLDEQTGHLKSGFMKAGTPRLMSDNPNKNTYGEWKPDTVANDTYGDSGGASRFFYCPKTSKKERNEGLDEFDNKNGVSQFTSKGGLKCKKCDKWKNSGNPCQCDVPEYEQQQWNGTIDKNNHPTIKPVALMQYLIKLVTPNGGTVLDPFMGSGSTGKAAVRGGFEFVGIEREEEYFHIAEARIQWEYNKPTRPEVKKKHVKVSEKTNETINKFFE